MNLDGVARLIIDTPNGSHLCSGVNIGGSQLLTAAHCLPDDAQFVHVAFGNNLVSTIGTSWQVHPAYNSQIGNGYDIAVLTYQQPLSAPIPSYPIYTGSAEVAQQVVVTGFGHAGHGLVGTVAAAGIQRAGLNRIDSLGLDTLTNSITGLSRGDQYLGFDFDGGGSSTDAYGYFFGANYANTGLSYAEVNTAPGDSGGPSFVTLPNGTPAIAGIHSYGLAAVGPDNTNTIDASWGEFSFDTRVSSPAIRRFIDYARLGKLIGDADNDQDIDAHDIDLQFANPRDWNGNGVADGTDTDFLIRHVLGTSYGDVNLDRAVNSSDWVSIMQSYNMPGSWSQGDMNGDHVVNSADIVTIYQHGAFDESQGLASGGNFSFANKVTSVPEPNCSAMLLLSVLAAACRRIPRHSFARQISPRRQVRT
jgi:hypothetical protein